MEPSSTILKRTAVSKPASPSSPAAPAARPYEQYVVDLLASYQRTGGLNNRDAHNMPSKRTVGQICEGLLQILFPGFHDDDAVQHGAIAELTADRLANVAVALEDQVRKAVRIGNP